MHNFRIIIRNGTRIVSPWVHISSPGRKYLIHYTIQSAAPWTEKGLQMSNRLSMEHSPYLLQHADNPVDWRPWGPEVFEEAKRSDKPIFLSIGYSTCH